MKRVNEMLKLREQGLTYQEIADNYGITRQRVSEILNRYRKNPYFYRPWTSERCIYQGLREWLNENEMTMRQLILRMGYVYNTTTSQRYIEKFKGNFVLRFDDIMRLIKLTEKTFEELFINEEGEE